MCHWKLNLNHLYFILNFIANNCNESLNLTHVILLSLELSCSKLEVEFSVVKLNSFALKVYFILPEHSTLCTHICFSQVSFSSDNSVTV